MDDVFMFVYGPLLFFFTQSVVFKSYRIRLSDVVHFIPALVFTFLLLGLLVMIDTDATAHATQGPQFQAPFYIVVVEILMFVHIFFYLFKSKTIIDQVLDRTLQLRSNINYDNLKILKFILANFTLLFAISLLHSVLLHLGFGNGLLITIALMVFFMLFFILSILVKMLNQATDMSGLITKHDYQVKNKYDKLKLTSIELQAYKSKLDGHIQNEKIYLNSHLKIDELAESLNMSPKILSQVINEGFACNFYDFINKFRVEYAKEILQNPTDTGMTIQEVMFDSGFNSKSSFNTAFKKFTGLTPTEFKNNIK